MCLRLFHINLQDCTVLKSRTSHSEHSLPWIFERLYSSHFDPVQNIRTYFPMIMWVLSYYIYLGLQLVPPLQVYPPHVVLLISDACYMSCSSLQFWCNYRHGIRWGVNHETPHPGIFSFILLLPPSMNQTFSLAPFLKYWTNPTEQSSCGEAQQVKKYTVFYRAQTFIAIFKRDSHWTVSWGRRAQSIFSNPVSLRSVLILSCHLRLCLPIPLLRWFQIILQNV
jgi:hypothetical protein